MRKIVLTFILLCSFVAISQRNLKDSSIFTPIYGFHYKANFAGGDLVNRFGFNNTLGGDIGFKLKNNLEFGVSGGFIFGSKFKQNEIFKGITTDFGSVTSQSGAPADIFYYMRGGSGHAHIGYVFTKLGNNPNSGLWINVGAGFLMHKIRIEHNYDDIFQLVGDYKKGYDKLTVGFSTRQFIGYLYQADYKFMNFYAGFEFIQGFTQNVRNYNFDSKGPENEMRLDMLSSFKIGWMIPIYKRQVQQYYY